MAEYVVYDYEMPEPKGSKKNFWHIYSTDSHPESIDFGHATIMTLIGPDTEQLEESIAAICDSINDTIDLAEKLRDKNV